MNWDLSLSISGLTEEQMDLLLLGITNFVEKYGDETKSIGGGFTLEGEVKNGEEVAGSVQDRE